MIYAYGEKIETGRAYCMATNREWERDAHNMIFIHCEISHDILMINVYSVGLALIVHTFRFSTVVYMQTNEIVANYTVCMHHNNSLNGVCTIAEELRALLSQTLRT